jgi:hypothetical protein
MPTRYVLPETDEIYISLVSCHVPFVKLFEPFLNALLIPMCIFLPHMFAAIHNLPIFTAAQS